MAGEELQTLQTRRTRAWLIKRTRERRPQRPTSPPVHRGQFAYVDGQLPDGTTLPLFRLRYGGSANSWCFAIHLASHDRYEDAVLPSGNPVGTPEEAPRLRLRPLPQRPHRVDPTPDEITGLTTS